ncbi:MAG: efflux RND transporter periplasmic adaptor subunit [Acidobacteriota bacterium]
MAMDVKREGVLKRKRIKYAIWLTIIIAGVAYGGFRISKLEPAAPTVEFATLWPDTVKRGPMVRDVKGLGSLVPEEIVWIPATSDGQVTSVRAKSGEAVKPETILVVLTNPDMELQANDLEWQVKQAEASFKDLGVRLRSGRFDSEAAVTRSATALEQAELNMSKKQQLFNLQLEPEFNVKDAVASWKQARNTSEAEQKKLEILEDSQQAQLESSRVQIDKLRATWERKKQQVRELVIKAGTDGVLQEMTLQVGQRITPGAVLAKVAQPWKLKAELKIAETQAKDILLGQKASIDTRNGIIPAHVIRIDPNVVNGTRTVDCKLDGPLPSGAVPDLSVDGTVEIERLTDVMYIGRPVFGQPNSQVSLFKIHPDGKGASRVTVKLGRGSVTAIEVTEGLQVGDRVILSDMSAQDQYQRIQF